MVDENADNGGAELPENASVEEAVELMSGFAESEGEGEQERQAPDSTNAHAEGDGDGEDEQEDGEQEEGEPQEDEEVAAPEFWSAEDKAAWAQLPAELKPLVRKYEQQRIEFVNEKAREAAQFRDAAAAELKKANDTVDQAAAWWQQTAPALQRAFSDKWAQVNWAELAEKNPAEWARLNQLRADEAALLAEAHRRGQADIEAAEARAQAAHLEARRTEHAKLAARLPDLFGTHEAARKTYDRLSNFLHEKGISADRIRAIYEANIIEVALDAMRWAEAQKRIPPALTGRAGEGARTTGNAAPRRVQPGPPSRGGNRASEAARQVGERFRRSGGADINDAAELIRLSGL